MTGKARRWAAAAALLLLVVGAALTYGQVSGTFAIFSAETENPNVKANGSWLPLITSATSSLDGSPYSQAHLVWGLGTTPSGGSQITGYTIQYADGGAATGTANCTGTYGAFSTVGATPLTADVTGTTVSDWWCFEIQGTSTSNWTTGNFVTFSAPQRLFVIKTVALANAVTNGRIDNTDTITLTYNQTRSNVTNVNVAFCTAGTIRIGTTAWTASCTTTPNIGTITGETIGSQRLCTNSTTTGNGTAVMTIKLAGCTGTGRATISGTGTFTSSGTGITSNGAQNACTANPTCSVGETGNL